MMVEPQPDHDYIDTIHHVDESVRGHLDGFCTLLIGPPDCGKVLSVLERLSSQLLMHFEQEEREGYLSGAVEYAPRLSRKAAELLQQHSVLSERLASLHECVKNASTSSDWWAEFVPRADEFIRELIGHEWAESELIQNALDDAFDDDVEGAGADEY